MSTDRVNELLALAERLARESEDASAITTVLRAKLFFNGDPTAQAQALSDELGQHISTQPYFWILASIEMQHYRIVSGIQRGDETAAQKAIDDFGATARNLKSVELEWHHQRMGVVQRMNAGDLVTTKNALFELREKGKNLQIQALRRICDLDLSVLLSQATRIPGVSADFGKKLEVKESGSQSIWAQKVRSLVDLGPLSQAEDALKRFPATMLYELPPDRNHLVTLTHLAQRSVATRAMEYVEALYSLLKPYTKYYVAGVSFHCEGSVSHYLGILARTLAREREAIAHLEEAMQQNARFGLEARAVWTRYELGRTLVVNPTNVTLKQARSHLTQALEDAQRLGLKWLYDDSKRFLTELSG